MNRNVETLRSAKSSRPGFVSIRMQAECMVTEHFHDEFLLGYTEYKTF